MCPSEKYSFSNTKEGMTGNDIGIPFPVGIICHIFDREQRSKVLKEALLLLLLLLLFLFLLFPFGPPHSAVIQNYTVSFKKSEIKVVLSIKWH